MLYVKFCPAYDCNARVGRLIVSCACRHGPNLFSPAAGPRRADGRVRQDGDGGWIHLPCHQTGLGLSTGYTLTLTVKVSVVVAGLPWLVYVKLKLTVYVPA